MGKGTKAGKNLRQTGLKGWTPEGGNAIFPPQSNRRSEQQMWFLKAITTWWNDKTIGTAWYTFRKGLKVGDDEQGNIYYRERRGTRRWVIYNGDIDASRIPPEWHRWLHYTSDLPPSEAPLPVKSWEKPHEANQTGSVGAYFPPGSLNSGGQRAKVAGDYEAWKPE